MYFISLMIGVFLLVSSVCANVVQKPCGPNEVRKECTSACPPTCQDPTAAATSCIVRCKDACFCKPGYLRDEITKECILACDCPKLSST